jgi:acyl carrier protein
MNGSTDIVERVIGIISERLCTSSSKITPFSSLYDLGADSLDQVEIVFFIEDEFGIDIPDEAFETFKTVKDIVDYLAEKV